MPDKKKTIEEENLMNLLAAALDAPVAAEAAEQTKLRRRRWAPLLRSVLEGLRAIKPAYGLVAAAAIVVVIVLLLSSRTPSGRGPGLAFADVIDRLQKVRTVSFALTTRPQGPQPTSGSPPTAGGGHGDTGRVMEILGRKARIDTPTGDTYIFDFEAGRMVCLNQTSMVGSEHEISRGARSILPGSSLEEVKQRLVAKGGKEEELGEQLVEGKRATGFRIERTDEVWTVWADARTGLLVRMDSVMQAPTGRLELTWSDFKFDVEFDDALFNLQAPAGYRIVNGLVFPSDPESQKASCQGNLKQIGIAIFMYLQAHDRQYPNSLDDLVTYLEGRRPLVCPGSQQEGYVYERPATPFLKVVEPRSTITVYDKPGNHEGGRNALFLDGHVQWLTEEEFQKLWAEQQAHSAPEHSPPAQEGKTP